MPHWMLEDAILHGWKRLKAMPLSINSPAAHLLPEALLGLIHLEGLIGHATPSVIGTFFKQTVATRLALLKFADPEATSETIDDVLGGFDDAGFSI